MQRRAFRGHTRFDGTSDRTHITDPRVRELADPIIEAQRKEIAEMKALIEDLEDQ